MSQIRQILIVDDDQDLRTALSEQLSLQAEFEIAQASTATAAIRTIAECPPDLVIMDVGLPDLDGRQAVRQLRADGFKRPIILLTGRDSEADTVFGLESGANDYVVKPFRFAVLLARIRVQLRQLDASEEAEFQIGPYAFRPAMKLLVDAKGARLKLTEKEAAILRFLHRANREPVPRETLLREVWGYNANVTTHTLETHIYRLRQKIEDNPAEAKLLVTDGGGYRLLP
ncbi:MAG: response regulator transcription factor [Roseiarcus sp.]